MVLKLWFWAHSSWSCTKSVDMETNSLTYFRFKSPKYTYCNKFSEFVCFYKYKTSSIFRQKQGIQILSTTIQRNDSLVIIRICDIFIYKSTVSENVIKRNEKNRPINQLIQVELYGHVNVELVALYFNLFAHL